MGYLLTLIARYFETLILAIASHLSLSISGIFFLGFPVLFTTGAYTMVIAHKSGLPLSIALLISFVIVLIISLGFALSYIRLSSNSFTVLTLASILALDAIIKSWDSVTNGVLGISGIARPQIATTLLALTILQGIIALIVLGLEYIMLKTNFGRSIRGLKEQPELLDSIGIKSNKIGITVLVIGGILAGISGVFSVWRIQFLDPSLGGIPLLLQVLTIAILAYKPSIIWIALSTFIITQLPELLRFTNLPSAMLGHLRLLIYSILIMIIIKVLSHKHISIIRSV